MCTRVCACPSCAHLCVPSFVRTHVCACSLHVHTCVAVLHMHTCVLFFACACVCPSSTCTCVCGCPSRAPPFIGTLVCACSSRVHACAPVLHMYMSVCLSFSKIVSGHRHGKSVSFAHVTKHQESFSLPNLCQALEAQRAT